jgi:hypothetical protein
VTAKQKTNEKASEKDEQKAMADLMSKEVSHISIAVAESSDVLICVVQLTDGRSCSCTCPFPSSTGWIRQEDEMIARCLKRLGK